VPVEMAIWRMSTAGPVALEFGQLGKEQRLEDMLATDLSLTGMDLLVVGRQVPTDFGGFVDILAVDSDAHVHVLELKRDKTPRDVVAQVLDYGSWAQSLTLDTVRSIFVAKSGKDFEAAFAEHFAAPVPDVFNADQQLTIVASELDAASDRIVTYLAASYGVPVNAVFFRYFVDGSTEYLARTWLIPPGEAESKHKTAGLARHVRPWNGRDFYAILGNMEHGPERWESAARFGFVGAGGGSHYWKPLRNLAPGNRVFAYVGGAGYVGVGEVTGTIVPLRDLETEVGGIVRRVVDQPKLRELLRDRAASTDDEKTEYAVPVRWFKTRTVTDAVPPTGLFSSPVTVCKLRDDRTIEVVSQAFGITED
jgi:hypothetical protein